MRAYLLLACCMLSACTRVDQLPRDNANAVPNGARVDLHTLPDGTRCAVITSWHGQGITCDWAHAQAPTVTLPEGARAVIEDGRVRWARAN